MSKTLKLRIFSLLPFSYALYKFICALLWQMLVEGWTIQHFPSSELDVLLQSSPIGGEVVHLYVLRRRRTFNIIGGNICVLVSFGEPGTIQRGLLHRILFSILSELEPNTLNISLLQSLLPLSNPGDM